MTEDEIARKLVNIFYKVHRKLGPGLLESVYETAICYELDKIGMKYNRQSIVAVRYEDLLIEAGFRADIVVEEKIIVEIKSIAILGPLNTKQLLTYLKLSGLKLGLLVNFNTLLIRDGITRLANNLQHIRTKHSNFSSYVRKYFHAKHAKNTPSSPSIFA
jgi:GxxExxY protein